jgi:hypothetical protein
VEASVNRRNNRWLAHDPDDVSVVPRITFLAIARDLGVKPNEGAGMPPYFFKNSETVTKKNKMYFHVFFN